MNKRVMMLFMSLFALAPAVFGSSDPGEKRWRGEEVYQSGAAQECVLREAPRKKTTNDARDIDQTRPTGRVTR